MLFFQSMGTGENGVNGVNVPSHVNRECRQGNGNVTRQLHNTGERNVRETQTKIKCATKMSHVQV